ncbi:hypothetical protein B0H19DRAFT_1065699 [Mycena capillaripes]|nr:hypothetical protein B0H19DRAFT_1065699 [Mycena capillaripes]
MNGLGFCDMQTNKPNNVGVLLYNNPAASSREWAGKSSFGLIPMWARPLQAQQHHNPNYAFSSVYIKKVSSTDVPMLFSHYNHNTYWSEEFVTNVGNLVSYTVHNPVGTFRDLITPLRWRRFVKWCRTGKFNGPH